MSLRHKVPFRAGELPVDNLGLEIDSRPAATEYRKNRVCSGYVGNGDLHGEAAILSKGMMRTKFFIPEGCYQVFMVKKRCFKLALVYKCVLLSGLGDNTRNT